MKAFAIGACLASLSIGVAQSAPERPSFEVASIKPSDPNPSNSMWVGMSADRAIVKYTSITLQDCIRAAYRVRDFQIIGPEWMSKTRFEITARLAEGASTDQIPEMLQNLLAERFQLTLSRDTTEQSVYALMVGKDGPRLKLSETKIDSRTPTAVGPDGKPRQAMMFRFSPSGVILTAPSANLASFVGLMSRFTARPVIDMTGLEGQYEFTLTFAPETMPAGFALGGVAGPDGTSISDDPAPSLFDAVKQYGLRLEARKAPVEMLTITHLEKMPTEN
jgi:uncharacterized protein (TIGR03435 family)